MIRKIDLKNFGPFNNFSAEFSNGLNLIIGGNGSGKTQLIGAILFIYVGNKSVNKKIASDYQSSEVSAIFQTGNMKFSIKRKLEKNSILDFSINSNSNLNVMDIIKRFGNVIGEPPVIIDSWNLNKTKYNLEKIIDMLLKFKTENIQFIELFALLESVRTLGKDKIYVQSGSYLYILGILNITSQMLDENLNLLIIDGFGVEIQESFTEELIQLFGIIGDKMQVILTLNKPLQKENNSNVNVINIDDKKAKLDDSPLSFKYSLLPYYPFRKKNGEKSIEQERIIQYVECEKIILEENLEIEFKEVKGNNPVTSVLSNVDQYVVAYLNSKSNKIGKIFWGIDDSRNIKGVILNYESRDRLRRDITNKLSQISPPISQHDYSIKLNPVYDKELNEIEDRYIIEVSVKPIISKYLYATGSDEVHIKTDAGKRKLKTQEIQVELDRRRRSKFYNV